jgi:hypothetical protein
MGVNLSNIKFLDVLTQNLTNGIPFSKFPLSFFDVLPVHGNFIRIISGLHKFLFMQKNVCINERTGAVNLATLITDTPADVIGPHIRGLDVRDSAVKRTRFSVQNQAVLNSAVNLNRGSVHCYQFLSVDKKIISQRGKNVKPFFWIFLIRSVC